MAAIVATNAAQTGVFAVTEAVLTADDTLTLDLNKVQLLMLRNGTAGALTATLDGSDGTTVNVDGIGSVSVAAGLAIAVPAGAIRAVRLASVREYCKGVAHLTGGAGLSVLLLNS